MPAFVRIRQRDRRCSRGEPAPEPACAHGQQRSYRRAFQRASGLPQRCEGGVPQVRRCALDSCRSGQSALAGAEQALDGTGCSSGGKASVSSRRSTSVSLVVRFESELGGGRGYCFDSSAGRALCAQDNCRLRRRPRSPSWAGRLAGADSGRQQECDRPDLSRRGGDRLSQPVPTNALLFASCHQQIVATTVPVPAWPTAGA
jgi:hypothetical protein